MRANLCGVVCLVIVILMVSLSVSAAAGPSTTPSKGDGGGGWDKPVNFFRGIVYNYDWLSPLSGIVVAVYLDHVTAGWLFEGSDVTDATGYFEIVPYDVVPYGTYQVRVSSQVDGYWEERRELNLPCVGQNFDIPMDRIGYAYPYQAYTHTPDCQSFSYEAIVANSWSIETGLFDTVSYTYESTTYTSTTYSSPPGKDLICRESYMSSAIFHTEPSEYLIRDPIVDVTYLYGEMIQRVWGDYADDYLDLSDIPSDQLKYTSYVDSGYSCTIASGSATSSTLTFGATISLPPPLSVEVFSLYCSYDLSNEEYVNSALLLNSGDVPCRWVYYEEGNVLHVWNAPT